MELTFQATVCRATVICGQLSYRLHIPSSCLTLLCSTAVSQGLSEIILPACVQSRVFQDQLSRKGIPFTVVGDTAFWAAKEVRDIMAYLRLASQPVLDVTALARIINVPKRGVGE